MFVKKSLHAHLSPQKPKRKKRKKQRLRFVFDRSFNVEEKPLNNFVVNRNLIYEHKHSSTPEMPVKTSFDGIEQGMIRSMPA
jgi:hypothetical protein